MRVRTVALRPVNDQEMENIRGKLLKDLGLSEEILAVCTSEKVQTVGELDDLSAESLVATNFSCEQVKLLRKLLTSLGLKRRSPSKLSTGQQAELQKLVGRELQWFRKNVTRDERNYSQENGRYLGYLRSRNPVDRALARHMLVTVNEPGVRAIAYGYSSLLMNRGQKLDCGIDLEDLLAEGNLGVLRAAEEFDPRAGYEFYTYAVWWIRANIGRYLLDGGVIRVPVGMQRRIHKFDRLVKRLPFDISAEDLSTFACKELATTPGKLDELLKIREGLELLYPIRLDYGLSDDEGVGDMYERAQKTNAFDMGEFMLQNWLQQDIAATLKEVEESLSASDRDKQILRLLYGFDGKEPMTLQSVGEIFGLSRERIRQIEVSMLKRLAESWRWSGKEGQLVAIFGRNPFT
jgi:RNA polymerase sigma factor (sigma-70 family)